LSVGLSNAIGEEIARWVIQTKRLPNEHKFPTRPWTIGESWIIPGTRCGVSSEKYPMSVLYEPYQLSAEQRRALKLLADAGEQGCPGAKLFKQGLSIDMLADLIRQKLAAGHRETVRVGYRAIRVTRIRITDTGRRALEG
jgi:hypothetical protein